MSLLDKLERKFGRFYIPNLTMLLTFGQGAFFLLIMLQAINPFYMELYPVLLLRGELWRLLTFPFIPPLSHPIFFAFALYLFYMMGTALENHWGEFRYNVFILIGYVLTVAASFAAPLQPAVNTFIGGSVFLAFAFLYPDFQLLLFFILPVRIKWLALLAAIGYLMGLVNGPMALRLAILASLGNFLLFFWPDILWRLRRGGRRIATQARVRPAGREVFHRCAACGATDQTHPNMLFRYCNQCAGKPAYCEQHFRDHVHVQGQDPQNH